MYNSGKLAGKTIFITGASRGIGKAIALKAAKDKANVVVVAKSATPNPKLEGTIFSTAEEVEAAGGKCLPVQVDVREEEQVQKAIDEAVRKFGGIDILVNNASAISLTGTLETPMKRYDLMNDINTRGTFMTSKLCIPYLKKSKNPHILNLGPPLSMRPVWFKHHVAYTIAKYGMSMCVVGMSEEFKDDGIAVNGLWPRTAIWTAAMNMLAGGEAAKTCRKPDICADAFYAIVTKNSREFTGNICIDETVLRQSGVTDFEQYAMEKGHDLILDGFIDDDSGEGMSGVIKGVGIGADQTKSKGKGSQTETLTPAKIFDQVGKLLKTNPDIDLGAYQFVIDGEKWYLDGESRSVGQGDVPSGAPVCTLTMKNRDFTSVLTGQTLAAAAFMSGAIKLEGSTGAALKLERLFKKFAMQLK